MGAAFIVAMCLVLLVYFVLLALFTFWLFVGGPDKVSTIPPAWLGTLIMGGATLLNLGVGPDISLGTAGAVYNIFGFASVMMVFYTVSRALKLGGAESGLASLAIVGSWLLRGEVLDEYDGITVSLRWLILAIALLIELAAFGVLIALRVRIDGAAQILLGVMLLNIVLTWFMFALGAATSYDFMGRTLEAWVWLVVAVFGHALPPIIATFVDTPSKDVLDPLGLPYFQRFFHIEDHLKKEGLLPTRRESTVEIMPNWNMNTDDEVSRIYRDDYPSHRFR